MSIQEQELDTKRLERDGKRIRKRRTGWISDAECVMKTTKQCITSFVRAQSWLEARYNQIARILYQEIVKNEKINYNPPRVTIKNEKELWWDMEIHTVTKVKRNQPDIVLRNQELKTCQIIEITVPIDTNLKEAYHQKEIKYIPLIAEMQRMYSDYKFSTSVITIGALGAVPKNLDLNLQKRNFEKEKIAVLIQRIQRAALTGTLKVCKTVMKMLNQE